MKRKYKKKSENKIKIAKDHIKTLFSEAQKMYEKYPELSHEYVKKARKIAMKFRIRLPKKYKRRFCRHCYHYLVPGKNARIRITKSKVVYFCRDCKKFMRFPLKNR
ncbi:ribonuclease P [Candidatus Woesearchaeota archaeon]|nr:ribonuclease P [Candidatus Woesearchaeota archaeon]